MCCNNMNSFSLPEAAEAYRISYGSLLKYVKNGTIPAYNVSQGTKRPVYKVLISDMDEFNQKFVVKGKHRRLEKIVEQTDSPAIVEKEADPVLKERKEEIDRNLEVLRIKEEVKRIESKLMNLLIELDEITK